MSRILIVSNDIVAKHMAGPGIRAWEFANLLSQQHEVTLAAPGQANLSTPQFTLTTYRTDQDLRKLSDTADLILTQGITVAIHPSLARRDRIVIVDFYDPFLVEALHIYNTADKDSKWHKHLFQLRLSAMNTQGRIGDFFLCASDIQRDYWLGQLSALGRLNSETYRDDHKFQRLIDIVPFGIPTAPPVHTRQVLKGVFPGIASEDKVILWGGGIYEWFDPFTLVRAMVEVVRVEPQAKLFFLGTRHPNPDIGINQVTQQAMDLADKLGLLNRNIFFNPTWVSYEERQNYLLEADVGVSIHLDSTETRFSYRTRILDYIWAGLPIVTTRGDSLAEIVQTRNLGKIVDYKNSSQVSEALVQLLSQETKPSFSKQFNEVARSMTWEEVSKPLLNFCANPHKAPDSQYGQNPDIAKAISGDYQHPQSYLGKAWINLRLGGVTTLLKEIKMALWWRLAGPK